MQNVLVFVSHCFVSDVLMPTLLDSLGVSLGTCVMQRVSTSQVDDLLQQDASNVEFQELRASLVEVIELTQELLREALQSEAATQPSPAAAAASAPTGGESSSWKTVDSLSERC